MSEGVAFRALVTRRCPTQATPIAPSGPSYEDITASGSLDLIEAGAVGSKPDFLLCRDNHLTPGDLRYRLRSSRCPKGTGRLPRPSVLIVLRSRDRRVFYATTVGGLILWYHRAPTRTGRLRPPAKHNLQATLMTSWRWQPSLGFTLDAIRPFTAPSDI